MAQPNLRIIGLLIAWFILGKIYGPIFTAALNLLYLPHGVRYG